MYIVFAFVIGIFGLINVLGMFGNNEFNSDTTITNGDVYRHEAFARSAQRYLKYNPAATGTITYQMMGKYLPDSLRSIPYDSTFKATVVSPGNLVVCGRLRNHAAVIKSSQNEFGMATIPLGKGYYVSASNLALAESNRSTCTPPGGI